jgi:hypothetical protein
MNGTYETWKEDTWPNRVSITAFKTKETLEKSRSLPRYGEDQELSPVYTLFKYMTAMITKRLEPLTTESTLFIATVALFNEVKEETNSNWFKRTLQEVGLRHFTHTILDYYNLL